MRMPRTFFLGREGILVNERLGSKGSEREKREEARRLAIGVAWLAMEFTATCGVYEREDRRRRREEEEDEDDGEGEGEDEAGDEDQGATDIAKVKARLRLVGGDE